jgi:hypothetical protein
MTARETENSQKWRTGQLSPERGSPNGDLPPEEPLPPEESLPFEEPVLPEDDRAHPVAAPMFDEIWDSSIVTSKKKKKKSSARQQAMSSMSAPPE